MEKRFDEAMEDSRPSFYLQFKAAKAQAAQLKKQGIFGVLLRLKHRVDSLRKVHRQSVAFMARLPGDFDRKENQQRKIELLAYEQQRQREVESKRAREAEKR